MSKASDTPSIQEKLDQLSEYVSWFQSDAFAIDQALEVYAKAEALAEAITHDLEALKNDVTVIRQKFDSES